MLVHVSAVLAACRSKKPIDRKGSFYDDSACGWLSDTG